MRDPDHPNLITGTCAAGELISSGSDDEQRAGLSSLLQIGQRWPTAPLASLFKPLRQRASQWAEAMPWPDVMREVVDYALAVAPGDNHQRLQWASASISMLVHLR